MSIFRPAMASPAARVGAPVLPNQAPQLGTYSALTRPHFAAWGRFATAIGRPELASDARYVTAAARKTREDELEELVTAWTSTRSPEDVTAVLQAAGIGAFTAATNKDLAGDPHLNERGYFVELPHPEVGRRKHVGVPWRMSESECRVRAAAPLLGTDTEQVLHEVCGYTENEIARLREAGALV